MAVPRNITTPEQKRAWQDERNAEARIRWRLRADEINARRRAKRKSRAKAKPAALSPVSDGIPRRGQVRYSPPTPPPEVIAEATRAAAAPRSLTAELMGDPPVGRRALDAKAGQIGLQAVAAALGMSGGGE